MNPPPILPPGWSAPPPKEPGPAAGISDAQWKAVAFIAFVFLCSLLLRLIYVRKMETSSVMFIGLPAILAVFVSLMPRSKSALGSAMKGTTIGLAVSAVLFGEGLICVLMAAPIAYFIALIIGLTTDYSRKVNRQGVQCVVWVVAAVMSFEGTSSRLSLSRDEEVRVERTLAATPAEVEQTLAATPSFRTGLPLYFRMGFPKPVGTSGSGLKMGDRRVIQFGGGEGAPGDLVMNIAARTANSVTFQPEKDTSHIAHWLKWQDSVVEWTPVDAAHTRVSWTLRYRRGLDPAWYFRPSERYGARLAAGYLIANLATPARETKGQ